MPGAPVTDRALLLAGGLVRQGNYNEAITEYKRFIYFATDSNSVCQAYVEIGRCHSMLNEWDDAVAILRKAASWCPDDSSREERRADIGTVLLAAGRDGAAEMELLRLRTFGSSPTAKRRASFLLGICYLYQARWDDAREAFASFPFNSMLDSLLSAAERPRNVSPSTARWLSTFLPGLGQFYAGDLRNGLNALAINAATLYFLTERAISGDYSTAALTGLPLFQRYYRGNIHKAEGTARSRNDAINRQYANQVLEVLAGQNTESTPLPER